MITEALKIVHYKFTCKTETTLLLFLSIPQTVTTNLIENSIIILDASVLLLGLASLLG